MFLLGRNAGRDAVDAAVGWYAQLCQDGRGSATDLAAYGQGRPPGQRCRVVRGDQLRRVLAQEEKLTPTDGQVRLARPEDRSYVGRRQALGDVQEFAPGGGASSSVSASQRDGVPEAPAAR